jgi:hypothetical protein
VKELADAARKLLERLELAMRQHNDTPEGESHFLRFEASTEDEEAIIELKDALWRAEL